MVRVIGFYKWKQGARFDHQYYRTKHMATARDLLQPLGLLRLESDEFLVIGEPQEGVVIAATYAYFDTPGAARAALAAAGPALLKSVPGYTDLVPELVMSHVTVHV
jgi:uncharacterized protein (TIGR02118 family)